MSDHKPFTCFRPHTHARAHTHTHARARARVRSPPHTHPSACVIGNKDCAGTCAEMFLDRFYRLLKQPLKVFFARDAYTTTSWLFLRAPRRAATGIVRTYGRASSGPKALKENPYSHRSLAYAAPRIVHDQPHDGGLRIALMQTRPNEWQARRRPKACVVCAREGLWGKMQSKFG